MTAPSNGQVELYQDESLEWRWRRRVLNGNIVADSGEGYARAIDARVMAEKLFPDVPIVPAPEAPDGSAT